MQVDRNTFFRCIKNKLVVVCALVLAACSGQPSQTVVLDKLRGASELATTEVVLSKVISATKSNRFLGIRLTPDATFLAESEATVLTGVDLKKLQEPDIQITDKHIAVLLPAVELLEFSYPPDKIKPIESLSRKNLLNEFSQAEKEKLYREAESSIRKNLAALGLKEKTEANTRKLFTRLLLGIGFESVEINFREGELMQ